MPNWFWVVVVVVGVLAIGMIRERWRMRGMEALAVERGFVLHSPFSPGERPPMEPLAKRLEGRRAHRWGAGLSGTVDGVEFTVAEHEVPGTGSSRNGVWYVMLACRLAPTAAELPPPQGGKIAREGEWTAWRLPGNLTTTKVETLLAHLPKLRQF